MRGLTRSFLRGPAHVVSGKFVGSTKLKGGERIHEAIPSRDDDRGLRKNARQGLGVGASSECWGMGPPSEPSDGPPKPYLKES